MGKLPPIKEISKVVMDNLEDDEVKAYFDKYHPDHDRVVSEVTELIEHHMGTDSTPKRGLLERDEKGMRIDMYEDKRSVTQQLQDIFNGHDEKWSKAYFNGSDPQHNEAVQRVTILSEAKYDGKLHAQEVFPVVSQTGEPNAKQAGSTQQAKFTQDQDLSTLFNEEAF